MNVDGLKPGVRVEIPLPEVLCNETKAMFFRRISCLEENVAAHPGKIARYF
jgi:hypothetical protein